MYNYITGIILAGGKSSRMGVNKALLPFGDTTIIEHITGIMKSLFKEVIMITNTPEEYDFIGLKKFKDIIPQKGPLSGIHSGIAYAGTEKNFIISCDIPLVTPELISYIIEYTTDKPITIVKADGFVQQLCGVYNKNILIKTEELLNISQENPAQKNKCRVLSLIEDVQAEVINADTIPCYKKGMFLNVNTIEDYRHLLNASE